MSLNLRKTFLQQQETVVEAIEDHLESHITYAASNNGDIRAVYIPFPEDGDGFTREALKNYVNNQEVKFISADKGITLDLSEDV